MLVTHVIFARKAVVLGIAISAGLGIAVCAVSPTALYGVLGAVIAFAVAFLSGLMMMITP